MLAKFLPSYNCEKAKPQSTGALDVSHWTELEAQAMLPRIHAELSGHQGPLEMLTPVEQSPVLLPQLVTVPAQTPSFQHLT